ncbi:hypothetical protein PP175_12540 [Aneurinibacillus sp. Ricciae_BoGa-3]|uniref:hypothetical protein n=1 Tax=Aneurinibacillus sp. Ricciae_BoGa-3 TaxID=3022697 RepID=UPI00234115FC|nr:hypothetical protein [Aneurinibacillus sp. Ricciae_BoGa-3]WCK56666.1 hypothetical protein PP175_12540 [Aneurinibacillus sp. Ricciae_BoGa-3]
MVKMTGEHVYNLVQLGIQPEVTFTDDCLVESLSFPIYKGMKGRLLNCIAGDTRYLGVFDLSTYAQFNEEIEFKRNNLDNEWKHEELATFEFKKGTRFCYFIKHGELKFTVQTNDDFYANYYTKKPELFSMQYLDSCINHCSW